VRFDLDVKIDYINAISDCDDLGSKAHLGPAASHPDLAVKNTYMHTCSGIHALHYSWTLKLGMTCLATCESNDDLAKISAELSGVPCYSDLEVLHLNDYPHTAVHIAGTPCQSYSRNGYKDGMDTVNGLLFVLFGKLHGKRPWAKRPAICISEIVDGILDVDQGTALKMIHQAYEQSGYVPFDYMLEALDYGACARRLRIYVIAIRRDVFEVLGPMPIPTPTPRDRPAQSARTAMGPASAGDTSHGLAPSDFTPQPPPANLGAVWPRRVLATDDGDQNGVVHDVDWPAPTQRSLTAPGIRNSGLFLYNNDDGTQTIVEPTDEQALRLQGLPGDAPHAGRWSIGNSFNGHVMEAIGKTVQQYLDRWYAYLESGHSEKTHMQFALSAGARAAATTSTDDTPSGCSWKMVDSGCTFTILLELSRLTDPRPCRIPITIGDGKVMYATQYGDATLVTVDSNGVRRRLTSRLSLHVPNASRDLLSQEQLIIQNDFGLNISPGGKGERHFYHESGYQIPISKRNGLSGIPIFDFPQGHDATADESIASVLGPHDTPTAHTAQASRAPDVEPAAPSLTIPPSTSPLVGPHTATPGSFAAQVRRGDGASSPKPNELRNAERRYARAAKPLAQLSTRLGVSVEWIKKAHVANIPGGMIDGSQTMSDTDAARDAHLAAASGQQRKSASQDARDVRSPDTVGHFTCDYVGPFAIPTLEGATGSHEFMELLTGFAAVFLVTSKGNFALVLRRMLIRFVYPFIIAMLSLTTDMAKEYGHTSTGAQDVIGLCVSAYIRLRHIAPRTPNHSDSERLHATLTRIMLRLMIQAGLPEPFWGLARLYALEIYLCLPGARATRYKGYSCSPRHAYTGAPEDLSHILPLGCLVHVLNESATITMRHLQRHGTAGLLMGVGRTNGSEYYIVWVPDENALRYSRNIRPHERIFPLADASLLWDPMANRATWRLPMYRHLEPFNPGLASSLRINPRLDPSPLDPFALLAPQQRAYDFMKPQDKAIPSPIIPAAKRARYDKAIAQRSPMLTTAAPPTAPQAPTPPPVPTPATTNTTAAGTRAFARGAVPAGHGVSTIDRLMQANVPITVVGHKEPGSICGERFHRYKHATTIRQLRELGATRKDIIHDLRGGIVKAADSAIHACLTAHIHDWESYLARSETLDPENFSTPADLLYHKADFQSAHAYAASRLLTPPSAHLLNAITSATASRLVSPTTLANELAMSSPRSDFSIPHTEPPQPSPLMHGIRAWPMIASRTPCSTTSPLERPALSPAIQAYIANPSLTSEYPFRHCATRERGRMPATVPRFDTLSRRGPGPRTEGDQTQGLKGTRPKD
jgi:site-specific DNA-cytosine methylase